MVALLTITLLTIISATSMYITSQNANATSQAASWQQALAGAESAVDQAMTSLNKGTWSGEPGKPQWYTAQGAPPTGKPPTTNLVPATDYPAANSYNYCFPETLAITSPGSGIQNESPAALASWVTVDGPTDLFPKDGNGNPLSNGHQAYRIRAAGVVGIPGPARVSNQKLDNELRKLSLRFDRLTGTAVTTPQAARRIEVVATPVITTDGFSFLRAITMQNWLEMVGSDSIIDSFDSSNISKSTNGLYDPYKRQSHGDVGLVSSAKNNNVSNLRNNAVYGNLQYSGPAVKNTSPTKKDPTTTGVQGTISTPFNTTLPATSDPTWTPDTTYAGGQVPNSLTASGTTKEAPTRIKVTDNLSIEHNLAISAPTPAPNGTPVPSQDRYIEIWVTGNYTATGQAAVTQASKVHVTWYVDGDISTAGGAYVNSSNVASNLSFIAIGSGSITISGSGNLIGTFYGPERDVAFTGNASLFGAVVGDNLKLSSGASIHYDEALGTVDVFNSPTVSSYAYASWFEDNSDPARSIAY
jgi:hypothetical protein